MITKDHRGEGVAAFVLKQGAKIQPIIERSPYMQFGRMGHQKWVCYEIIGYLPRWGTCGRGRGELEDMGEKI